VKEVSEEVFEIHFKYKNNGKKSTFSLSVLSNFLSSRFDSFPGATAIGNVVEKTYILPEQLAPYL
jgi:hypothetical protein